MCALGSGCSVPPDMSGVTPDTSPDRVPGRLQLELEKAIRHRTYQVCTEHAQFSNGRQQLVQQLAEGRPPDLYGVWHRSLHRMLVQLPMLSFILGAIYTTTENLLETGKMINGGGHCNRLHLKVYVNADLWRRTLWPPRKIKLQRRDS